MSLTKEQQIVAKALSIPSGYAKVRLGLKLHPTHMKILDSLFETNPSKISFRAANNVGKTSSIALVAILYAIEILGADVIYTSASHNQIKNQLMPKLKGLTHLYPTWEFQDTSIKVGGISKLIAFATNDGIARFQGFHSTDEKPLLIVVDEAAGVKDDIYQAISKCFPTYLMVMGSPIDTSGTFYAIETEPNMYNKFLHFKLTQHECLEKDGYWIKQKDIDDYLSTWGGYEWLILSTIYAEFSSTTEDGLISLTELNKCYEFPPNEILGVKHVGIDVAASGGDFNVISYRNGNKVEIISIWREPEMMRACDKIAGILNELKEKYNIQQCDVSLDADGMGIGFISRLKDLNWRVNEYHGGAKPENDQYANNIAEDWLNSIDKIKKCQIILPNNEEFKLQILSRKQTKSTKGKLAMESKADMRARGVKSPDIADAVFISLSTPSKGEVKSVYTPQRPIYQQQQYNRFC